MVGLATRRGLSTEATAAAAAGGLGDGAELPLDLDKPKPPRNSLVGMVVSDKMDKSIVVRVRINSIHKSVSLMAHGSWTGRMGRRGLFPPCAVGFCEPG